MLIYRLGLWFFLISLILIHRRAHAEWVAIDARYQSHPLQTAYIDPKSVSL